MPYVNPRVPFNTLVGKTLASITGATQHSDEVIFTTIDGEKFRMHHYQDCCESVSIEDVNGDIQDLVGSPILVADERTSEENSAGTEFDYQECFLWTFYHIATAKGTVVLRWYGESNGYYGVEVDFEKVPDNVR